MPSIGKKLQPFTGNGDVSKWVKISWVGRKTTNKHNKAEFFCHSCLKKLRLFWYSTKDFPTVNRSFIFYKLIIINYSLIMYSLLQNRTSRLHVNLFYKLIIKNITFCMYACIWYVTILQLSYSQKYTWRVANMQLKNFNCNNDLAINGKPFGYILDLWCDLHVHQVSLYSFLKSWQSSIYSVTLI